MKIAMITEGREPLIGGGQVYAKYLCDFLVRIYGCSVDVFTRAYRDEQGKKIKTNDVYAQGWNVYRIGPVGSFFSSFYRIMRLMNMTIKLYKNAKIERYDLIHAHALLAGIPARIVGKLLHIPVVYTVHGTMHMDVQKKGLFYYAEKLLVTWIPYDLEISVSHKVLDYNPRSKRVVVIYPGIDKEKFETVIKAEKLPGRNYIFVGRLDWQKGVSYLIRALGNIDSGFLTRHQFHLNIVGDGPDRVALQELARNVGRDGFITFLGKFPFEQTITHYQQNTCFILPSLAEGQPVVVMEAFANKLPVIVTDVGDNARIVTSNIGIVVPPGDIDALRNAIEKTLLMSIEDIEHMGEKGYQLVQDTFGRENIIAQIYSEYTQLLQDFTLSKHKK